MRMLAPAKAGLSVPLTCTGCGNVDLPGAHDADKAVDCFEDDEAGGCCDGGVGAGASGLGAVPSPVGFGRVTSTISPFVTIVGVDDGSWISAMSADGRPAAAPASSRRVRFEVPSGMAASARRAVRRA